MVYTFESRFANRIDDFIAQKKALGFSYLESTRILRDFDRFCLTHFPTVATFFAKYGRDAKVVCPEVPEHIHPHMMRHTRAMHLYQSGMPLVLLSQYLGHAQVETTMIYAYADTEMKRAAIQKADKGHKIRSVTPEVWADNEEMILKLSGLT